VRDEGVQSFQEQTNPKLVTRNEIFHYGFVIPKYKTEEKMKFNVLDESSV